MPSYFNTVLNPNMQVTASMREIIADVRNAFLSCSFVRTVQSGSVDDLTTLTPSLTANGQITYDIFAFNDALQSTSPLFIKVRYTPMGGLGSSMASPQLFFQMGTAHDSSGSLTSVDALTEVGTAVGYSTEPTSGSSIYASGDGSYMALTFFPESDEMQIAVFERLYNTNGQPNGTGFHMMATNAVVPSNGKTLYSQMALNGTAPSLRESVWIPNSRPSREPAIYDGRLVLGLFYPFHGKPYNPSPNILLGTSTDFPTRFMKVAYTVYGTTGTYMYMGSNLDSGNVIQYSNGRILMRVE